ncbi:MAG: MFS transporter [Chloroflexi bacterium]|nr:MFS transporter [Chloroflexota bacterium]
MRSFLAGSRLWSPFGFYYGWVIVASALVMNMAASPMSPVAYSFFLTPMGQELGWSRSDLSWAITFRLVVAGVSGPLLGPMIDRHGSRWITALAGLVAGGSLLALSWVGDLWALYLIFAVSGLAGFGGPAGALLTIVPVGKWFIVQRGRAMAFATMGFPLGTVIVIQVAQWLISTAGWRTAWQVFGIVLLAVVTPVSCIFMRRMPEDHGLRPDGARPPSDDHARSGPAEATADVHWTRGEAFRTPVAWVILAAMVLMGFALSGTLVHRVAFWQGLGMSPALVALGTAADPFTVLFSAMAFGMLGERVPVRFIGLAAGGGMAISMLPMIFTNGEGYTIFLHGFTWGWFAGALITVFNLIWPNYFGRQAIGAIQGVVLPASVVANGIAAPAFGYLLDSGGSPALVWTLSLVLFVVSGLLLLSARPPGPREADRG